MPRHKRGASRATGSLALASVLVSTLAGCAASPYDFPQPAMIGNQRGYSMTGFVGTGDADTAREKIERRLEGVCPKGATIVDLKTDRTDAAIGTKIMRYEALVTCKH